MKLPQTHQEEVVIDDISESMKISSQFMSVKSIELPNMTQSNSRQPSRRVNQSVIIENHNHSQLVLPPTSTKLALESECEIVPPRKISWQNFSNGDKERSDFLIRKKKLQARFSQDMAIKHNEIMMFEKDKPFKALKD